MDRQSALKQGREMALVVFKLGREEFASEIASVREISRMLPITPIPEAPRFLQGVVNLRGRVIAVIDLAQKLGLYRPEGSFSEYSEKGLKPRRMMVVEAGEEIYGLAVDEMPEVLKVNEEAMEGPPEMILTQMTRNFIKGLAKVGERFIPILNLKEILSPSAPARRTEAPRAEGFHGQDSGGG